ncbi:MAG: hypothetical protein JXR37_06745 [Kiritimatiellae bacterium]|nr:hypothetical protein [Kiritimatiellia bacterium]
MDGLEEIAGFVGMVQAQYAEAFASGDHAGLLQTSFDLLHAYAAEGNATLAGKWADECLRHTEDPMTRLAVKLLLLAARMQCLRLSALKTPD